MQLQNEVIENYRIYIEQMFLLKLPNEAELKSATDLMMVTFLDGVKYGQLLEADKHAVK